MTDDIDRLLRQDARIVVADDGFKLRVMDALPTRHARPRPWVKPVLVFGSAALGSALAVALSPGGGSLLQGFQDLMQLRALTSEAIGGLAMSTALLVSAIILATDTD